MFRLTPPTTRVSERDVIAACIRILRTRGYWVQRNPVGMFKTLSGNTVEFGPVGIPDFTAIHARYPAVFVEFKRPGKVLRKSQRTTFAEVQLGYRLAAVMVDSSEELVAFLEGHEARSRATNSNAPVIETTEAFVPNDEVSWCSPTEQTQKGVFDDRAESTSLSHASKSQSSEFVAGTRSSVTEHTVLAQEPGNGSV